jgi:glycerol dehydrogenase-like iron-containing ADH family enzyme
MSMKKTDLEKNKMLKAANLMKASGISDRFGKGNVVTDRKEQRKLDSAAGLVPFACKLPSDLVTKLQAHAEKKKVAMNDLVKELLEGGLKG